MTDAARGDRLSLLDQTDAAVEQLVETTVLRGANDDAGRGRAAAAEDDPEVELGQTVVDSALPPSPRT